MASLARHGMPWPGMDGKATSVQLCLYRFTSSSYLLKSMDEGYNPLFFDEAAVDCGMYGHWAVGWAVDVW